MSSVLDIRFLDSHSLGEERSAEDIVRVFLMLGFAIMEFRVGNKSDPWPQEPGEVAQLLRSATEAKSFSFRAWHTEWRLEIRQCVAWNLSGAAASHHAWVVTSTDNTPYFWRPEYNPDSYSRLFLEIGRRLYDVLRPSFGWIDFDYGLRTTHDDIDRLQLPALYWANFFGPRYVANIGRDRILNAPAWRVESLSDGGVLYVLASCPGLSDDYVLSSDVGAYFAVPNVR